MNTTSYSPGRLGALAALTFLAFGPSLPLQAGPTNTPPSPGSGTASATAKPEGHLIVPSPFVEPPVPEAVFVMPKSKADGKDPFFPKSDRPYGIVSTPTKPGPAPVVAELILRGISGSDEKPLAIINTTTFGVEDELDVTTKAGKMRIRCLEINKAEGTVSVQIGVERRLLRLPPAK